MLLILDVGILLVADLSVANKTTTTKNVSTRTLGLCDSCALMYGCFG